MSEELISKKDLLLETGISYGQLYRWKRKDLIPEEWFIRQSTYTGQETFFPKAQILERISKIQAFKDMKSLDELAEMFSPTSSTHTFEAEGSSVNSLISQPVLNLYREATGFSGTFDFDQMVSLCLLEKSLKSGDVSLEEGKMMVQCLSSMGQITAKDLMVVLTRKMGVSYVSLIGRTDDLYVDEQAKVIVKINILEIAQELKNKLI